MLDNIYKIKCADKEIHKEKEKQKLTGIGLCHGGGTG